MVTGVLCQGTTPVVLGHVAAIFETWETSQDITMRQSARVWNTARPGAPGFSGPPASSIEKKRKPCAASPPSYNNSCLEETQRLRTVAHQQVLGLLIVLQNDLVGFAPVARLLVAAERRTRGIQVIAVRPHAAGFISRPTR